MSETRLRWLTSAPNFSLYCVCRKQTGSWGWVVFTTETVADMSSSTALNLQQVWLYRSVRSVCKSPWIKKNSQTKHWHQLTVIKMLCDSITGQQQQQRRSCNKAILSRWWEVRLMPVTSFFKPPILRNKFSASVTSVDFKVLPQHERVVCRGHRYHCHSECSLPQYF